MSDIKVGDLIVGSGGLYRVDRLTPERAYVTRIIASSEIPGQAISGFRDIYISLHRHLIVTTEQRFNQAVAESEARDDEIEAAKHRWRDLNKARNTAVSQILAGKPEA